ncbi:hypothetical protein NKH77_03880 [Streptomyces sp. M19]
MTGWAEGDRVVLAAGRACGRCPRAPRPAGSTTASGCG